ncbi:MAG: phosphatase PAP2 family protein [Desulfatiglandales bacterium]
MEWAIAMRSDLLTPIFKAFSALGYGRFLLLFVAVGYWIFNKNIFARLGLWLLLSALLNAYLKDLFQDPRPDPIFQVEPRVGLSYGFPSGHAQIAMVTWFWLAWEARKTWIWILSSILVAGICFSRLYLGVHDVEDVLAGIGIGLISLLIFVFLTTKKFQWWHRLHPLWQIMAIAVTETLFFLTWPGKLWGGVVGFGVFLIGFWIGVGIERRRLFFQKHRDWRRIIASGVIGVIVFVVLSKGFQAATGSLENGKTAVALIQALVTGVYMTALAPWIFQRLKLADKGKPPET